jgi:predicted neuraminidase
MILRLLFLLTARFDEPVSQFIFPPEQRHNHGSCIVELPNGDLLTCWYRGSGERTADDCEIVGARLRKGSKSWSAPFPMADTPGFPDTNSCMTVGKDGRLYLFYGAVQSNQWESTLLKMRTSRSYSKPGPPKWDWESAVHFKPGPEFAATVKRDLFKAWDPTLKALPDAMKARLETLGQTIIKRAEDKLSQRLGWMARAHPTWLDDKRLLLPLYSDGFDFSLMAITEDGGATWKVSQPVIGAGNVQPSVVRRKDGALVAYFRDNGPPPNRVMVSESRDEGMTWSEVKDIEIPDTGAGVEVLKLKSGRWIFVNNDTEQGRYRLSLHVSEDEGKTWRSARRLEDDPPGPDQGGYSYPSIIQSRGGSIHVTYSHRGRLVNEKSPGESIKHVHFTEEWLLAGVKP